ncbi:TetR/AcrR family transcriptional regulator [Holophaga foetida]|uniref:TetR/AcrR family transcriptional regulator n=1 Tax=Holophaga foetida TaxID=35839 RepID=UPI0002475305|nr:TetR/AcrR family transcriptional regulator [Holophaga foetida]
MSGETKNLIKAKFVDIYGRRGLRKMNIKMLCSAIPIARTTFYSYFNDLDEVLDEVENDLIDQMFHLNVGFKDYDLASLGEGEHFQCFNDTLALIKRQVSLYRVLMGRHAEPTFAMKWKNIIKAHFMEKYRKELPEFSYTGLVIEQIACSILGAYRYWIFEDDGIAPDVISDLCCARICLDFMDPHGPRFSSNAGRPGRSARAG